MKYKYTLPYDYYYQSDRLIGIEFCNEWIKIQSDGCVRISKSYSWNGCNFVPDFKGTYYASLLHDALYQYKINRFIADKIFLDVMRRDEFYLSTLYYLGVKFFGWFYYV